MNIEDDMNYLYQPSLLSDVVSSPHTGIVNVASVPQRSPFRYPGGKTWLIPRIRQWLRCRPCTPALLIEPFAGGGIVSLTAAAEMLAEHALMVELHEDVAAVWETIVSGAATELAERITRFVMTRENVEELLSQAPANSVERAFTTIVRNRASRGGILAYGAGLIKTGENGKGIASRWYPETLARRIQDIVSIRERISFVHGDGVAVMRWYLDKPDAVFFIDPPYTASRKRAGTRLYVYNDLNHEELFALAAPRGGFSYDLRRC